MTLIRATTKPDAEASWRPRAKVYLVIRLLGGRSGGAERLFCEMANMLADENYDVTCIYCDSSKEPPFYPLSHRVTRLNLWGKTPRQGLLYRALDGVAKGYPKSKAYAPADWLARNLYFVRRLHVTLTHGKPDVVISFLPPANTPALLAGVTSGAPVIPTNHNVPEEDYRSELRWDQNPVDRMLRFWALNSAERVHVLFPTFAEWFPKHIRDKIVVVTNYVSPEFDQVNDAPVPRRKEVVAVGRLAPVKNYMALVEAWAKVAKKHPDWSVRIFGEGPQRAALAARIRELGVERSVHLMGHTREIKDAYLAAEILCHPAIHEGFGLTVAEALACGLPVVAFSDCAGVNEFVRDGENGLMVDRAEGADGLAKALDRLISDSSLRAKIRAACRPSVDAFSQRAFRDRWTTVIDEVAAKVHS